MLLLLLSDHPNSLIANKRIAEEKDVTSTLLDSKIGGLIDKLAEGASTQKNKNRIARILHSCLYPLRSLSKRKSSDFQTMDCDTIT
jgi:hypothetical protein